MPMKMSNRRERLNKEERERITNDVKVSRKM